MREVDFIDELNRALNSLPVDQREDILGEYRSHFFEGKERGKSEEDIAKAFGDPKAIARTYVADYHFEQWQTPTKGQGIGKSFYHLSHGLLMMFSLLFFNFFVMLWPVLTISICIFACWIIVGVFTGASVVLGLVGLFGGFFGNVLPSTAANFVLFFYSLGSFLFTTLCGLGLFFLTRVFTNGILKYIRLNIKLVGE
jgi:uncharacterized membrane protein